MKTTTPLTDAEISRLEGLLASPIFEKQAMGLDEMQGFLCAVLSAPVVITASQWMPAVLGNPKYESAEQEKEVTDLVLRFGNDITAELQRGESLSLLLNMEAGDAEDEYDYETWCQAYLDGVDFSTVPWDEAGDEEEVNDLLFTISLLAGEIEPRALRGVKPADLKQLMVESREDLPMLVAEIYDYFSTTREGKPAGEAAAKPEKKDDGPKLH
jgi:uncharacterized protein